MNDDIIFFLLSNCYRLRFSGWWVEQEFNFGHVEFKTSARHLYGYDKELDM